MCHFLRCPGRTGLPKNFAVVAIEAENDAFVFGGNGLSNEDVFVPNNGRGVAAIRKRRAPFYIFGFGPVDRKILFLGNSLPIGTTPKRPVLGERGQGGKKQQDEDRDFHTRASIGLDFIPCHKV